MMQGSLFLLVMGAILLLAGATHLFLQLLGGIIWNGLKKRGPQQYLGGADKGFRARRAFPGVAMICVGATLLTLAAWLFP